MCWEKSLQCTRSDDVQQEPETNSNQSQFLRSRVPRSQCWDSQNSSKNFTTKFQFVSTWNQIRSMFGHTTKNQRKTSVGWTHGYEKQYSRSLHEVFGWATNTVALKEAWTSRHWRHGRLRACEQRFQSSRRASILSFNS